MKRTGGIIAGGLGILLLGLVGWTAYANVYSDDTALRARAEQMARETAGCGSACKLTGIEGTRGIITETLSHYIRDVGTIVVSCRRAQIAFGEYECTAAKR